ncbi:LOW QUALITY PROTEIN: putative junctophilin [Schistosoma mansoni]|uniref:putative junctophilin n=1 Tax=Schistosoma mansoni TaxID=6183 RepID=UPI00022DC986|nr:LOW QUALITY PROTEIN: putative junctophilin [Schistosoma mansoni]|eukprot:XP_018654398.1 LOW QUALITY PROTEIN: putative junctophilin [Schistosoma mansoni]
MDTDGGRFDFNDGGTYIGNWYQGSAHGLGLATGPNGVGEYSGEWNLGFETMWCIFMAKWKYVRWYMDGKRHGNGIQVRGKWIYQGEFNSGTFGQYGVKTSMNSQAKYEGSWSLNRFEGFGIETCADGSIYAGAWSKGFRHGLGVRKSFISYKTNTSDHLPNTTMNTETITTIPTTGTTTATTPIPTSQIESMHDFDLNSNHNIDQMRKIHLTNQSPKLNDKHYSSSIINLPLKESIPVSRKAVIGRAIMRRLKKQHSAIELGQQIQQKETNNSISNQQNIDYIIDYQSDHHHNHNNNQLISVIEIYSGEWFQDQRSGYGIAERSNGFIYIGEWIRNQKHGYGILINPNECVEDALIRAELAAKQAKLIALEEAKEYALKARKAADLAISIIQKALHLSNQARELAYQLEPQFHQPGIEWRRKCQYDINVNDNLNEIKSSRLYSSNSNLNISTDCIPTSSNLPIPQSSYSSSPALVTDLTSHLSEYQTSHPLIHDRLKRQYPQQQLQPYPLIKPSTNSLTNIQDLKQRQRQQQQGHSQKRRKFFRKFLSRDSTPNSMDRVDESPMDVFECFANLNSPRLHQSVKPIAKVSNEDVELKGISMERNIEMLTKQMSSSTGDIIVTPYSPTYLLTYLPTYSSYHTEDSKRIKSHFIQHYWIPENLVSKQDDNDLHLRQLKVPLPQHHSYQIDTIDGIVPDIESISEKSELSSVTIQSAPHYYHPVNIDSVLNESDPIQSSEYSTDLKKLYFLQNLNQWDNSNSYDSNQYQMPTVYAINDGHEYNAGENVAPVIIGPNDDTDDDDDVYESSSTSYIQPVVPRGHHHSLERYGSSLLNQRLPESKRIAMNDHSTPSQTRSYPIRHSNYHQIPISKLSPSSSFIPNDHIYQTDDDVHSMNCQRFTSIEYMKPSKRILNGIQDSIYIDPREMNMIKQTNLPNHNRPDDPFMHHDLNTFRKKTNDG